MCVPSQLPGICEHVLPLFRSPAQETVKQPINMAMARVSNALAMEHDPQFRSCILLHARQHMGVDVQRDFYVLMVHPLLTTFAGRPLVREALRKCGEAHGTFIRRTPAASINLAYCRRGFICTGFPVCLSFAEGLPIPSL